MPLPIVTDLDGDGKNEVVVLADGGTVVRVLSVPVASGETLVSQPPMSQPTATVSAPSCWCYVPPRSHVSVLWVGVWVLCVV